jgi:hypothetical protein
VRRFLIVSMLAFAVAVGVGFFTVRTGTQLASGPVPAVPQVEPPPGGPPVIWLAGTIRQVAESEITIQNGEGASIRLQRLAAGASRFLRITNGRWREVPTDETDGIRVGERACAEALLDGTTFVALRVFVGALGCGPA